MSALDMIASLLRGRQFSIHIYSPASVVIDRLQRFVATGIPKPHVKYTYTAEIAENGFRFERDSRFWNQNPLALVGVIDQEDGFVEVKGTVQMSKVTVRSYLTLAGFAFAAPVVQLSRVADAHLGQTIIAAVGFGLMSAVFFGAGNKLNCHMQSREVSESLASLEVILETETVDPA